MSNPDAPQPDDEARREKTASPPAPGKTSFGWPAAFTVVAIAILGVALWVFEAIRSVPGDVVESGRAVLSDLTDLARAFNEGHVETSFLSYATEVSGNTYLQFATLDQTEVFERTDHASTLWGQLELPEVVVHATAPVTYTYYLDLEGAWHFQVEGNQVKVSAPPIRFNKPAVDISQLEFRVSSGSLFRDEEAATEALRAGITAMARRKAQENTDLVREVGRRRTEEFIATWLLESFAEPDVPWDVEVHFADEDVPILQAPTIDNGSRLIEPGEGPR